MPEPCQPRCRTHLTILGVTVSYLGFIAVLSGALFGLAGWGTDALTHGGPFHDHRHWPYLVSHYLVRAAFFGTWMYWCLTPIQGRKDVWRALAHAWPRLWLKLLAALVVYVVAEALLDTFVR